VSALEKHRLILRAEVVVAGETLVTRTREVSAQEIMLPLWMSPALGTKVDVRLSFPGLVDPFGVAGTVVAHHASDGPGETPAITVRVDAENVAYQKRLAQLVSPTDVGRPAEPPSYRILIVEDNSMIRDMFAYGVHKYFKARGGVTVDVAPDGADAWNLLVASRYDLAIVDYYLPIVNGAQLIAKVRADHRFVQLPVVAISIGGEDARTASIAAGADLFLDKPIVLRDLFATLDQLVLSRGQVTS
jgi:CheY-like chemotaxis protein